MQTEAANKIRAVLFDFDGTLADTLSCIIETARTVLLAHGFSEDELGDLRRLVGPPFPQAYSMVYGVSEEEAASITADYRSIYEKIGARAWPLYEGVRELLARLHDAGLVLGVVSSKGQHLIERGLADNDLTQLFEVVGGNNPADPVTKEQTLARILGELESVRSIRSSECAMVGDRRFDIEAAHACSVPSIGVTWGATCERSELEEAEADAIVDSPEELAELLLGGRR